MKTKLLSALLGALVASVPIAFADDGELVNKSMSRMAGKFKPAGGVTVPEAEHAFIDMMRFYVPAQAASGLLLDTITYNNIDLTLVEELPVAKPLVGVYIYGPTIPVEGVPFAHSYMDAFAAVSLDDGLTWKKTNLSESAARSSFTLSTVIEPAPEVYPGGAYNVVHATAGNKVLVAWPSRYCGQGQPAYAMTTEDPSTDQVDRLAKLVEFLQSGNVDLGVPALPDFTSPIDEDSDDLYLLDAFGVGGSQGSIDFAAEGYPQAGEVPFGCVWTARGVLLPGDDPRTPDVESSYMVWTKAERLTSGRRDPNRLEVAAVPGAGFVLTWQEDPEGLRPGQGEGPGEGWSGAVAHDKTDVWYSFINWEYFDIVEDPVDDTIPLSILDLDLTAIGRPQVFVPMAVPMRLTNNDRCNAPNDAGEIDDDLYCDFALAEAYGLRDQCAATIEGTFGNQGQTITLCVADTIDGIEGADLPNRANTGSTRPRTALMGYDASADDKSGWVVVAAEESKGLGNVFFTPAASGDDYAVLCTEGDAYPCQEEIGKNAWYFSFDMGTPDTSAGIGEPNSLVSNLVSQGNLLNQPEVYWETGEFFGKLPTSVMAGGDSLYGDYDFDIASTEIARRTSILVQPIAKALASESGLLAVQSWKQGPMRQGGPADVMMRRFVLPEGYDGTEGIEVNPYAFENMVCDVYYIEPNTNPYYPGGVCADPATNLSSVVPDTCVDSTDGGGVTCPTVTCTETDGSETCIGDTNPILQGSEVDVPNTMKVLTWHQCPSEGSAIAENSDFDPVTCEVGDSNLTDQSWYNPLDVSKGHRGFLDGDFVMFLYAWSPTWRLNAVGHDRYELYVRRSFDGGDTWTTTPSSFLASDGLSYSGDGTVTCETYRDVNTDGSASTGGDLVEPHVCYEYLAGAAEQARNITQHSAMRTTTLDPRYAPTAATIADGCTDGLFLDDTIIEELWTCDDTSEDDSDLRDPSRYFMVFETGDNTTVAEGEAEPEDLFYGRAEGFGDDYVVWTETDTAEANPEECYPTVSYGVDVGIVEGSGFCNEFDRMNRGGDTHSSEANLEANPDGSKMYGVWAQWVFDDSGEEVVESEAMARRIWWIDDYVSSNPDLIYTLPGSSQ